MRKVLVVAYYTPPLGMSGVMRVTKLVKFLPRFNWQPVVLTVKPVAYYHYDEDLLKDWAGIPVYRSESLDPARLRHLLFPARPVTRQEVSRPSLLANTLCFPDAKAGWCPFALQLGEKLLVTERPDAIFASAPPFTALMVGQTLSRASGLPLVSDFRDPWPMGLIPPPRLVRGRIERLRHNILKASTAVLAVNEGTAAFLEGRAEILENGFDPEEFAVPPQRGDDFSVVYVGNVWGNEPGLQAVVEATSELARVRLVGSMGEGLRRKLARYSNFEYLGLKSHQETVAIVKGADLLLYLGKPLQAAGLKLYEYLGAGRPILAVGERSEAGRLIEQHRAGIAVNTEAAGIRAAVEAVRAGRLAFAPFGIERYNRLRQAERLAAILDRLVR